MTWRWGCDVKIARQPCYSDLEGFINKTPYIYILFTVSFDNSDEAFLNQLNEFVSNKRQVMFMHL